MRREKDRQKKAEKDRKTSEIWKGERQIKNQKEERQKDNEGEGGMANRQRKRWGKTADEKERKTDRKRKELYRETEDERQERHINST